MGTHIEPNPRVTFRMLHEDQHLLVIEKAAGVVTAPGVGHQHDTLLNGLYATHGESFAAWVHDRPGVKRILRTLMDRAIAGRGGVGGN